MSLTVTEEVSSLMGQEPITLFYVVMLSLTGLIGIVVQPHIMGVCGAGRTEFEGRFGFTVGNFIKRFCTIAWTFTGLACIIIYLTPENGYLSAAEIQRVQADPGALAAFANQVFGRAAHDILPTISVGLVGLLMAALLAAVMSTCDAQMVVGSGLFTENIYKRFIRPRGSERHYLWVGRLTGLGIVCLALLMLTQFDNVIQVLTRYIQPIPTFMGLAFWFGITWRGYTARAVWASTITTALAWYLTQIHNPFEIIAALGSSQFFQLNIDYLPGLVRGWLYEQVPGIMQVAQGAGGEVAYRTRLPYQILIYLSCGAAAGLPSLPDSHLSLMRRGSRSGHQLSDPARRPGQAGPFLPSHPHSGPGGRKDRRALYPPGEPLAAGDRKVDFRGRTGDSSSGSGGSGGIRLGLARGGRPDLADGYAGRDRRIGRLFRKIQGRPGGAISSRPFLGPCAHSPMLRPEIGG